MALHFRRMLLGGVLGALLGAVYPMAMAEKSWNSVPALTAEYALVCASAAFALSNYLAFRQRLLRRIAEGRGGD